MNTDLQSLNLITPPVKVPSGYDLHNNDLSLYKMINEEQDASVLVEKISKMTKKDFELLAYENNLVKLRENKSKVKELKKTFRKLAIETNNKILSFLKKTIKINENGEIMSKEYFISHAKRIFSSLTNMKKVYENLERVSQFLRFNDYLWYKNNLIQDLKTFKKDIEFNESNYFHIKENEKNKRLKNFSD